MVDINNFRVSPDGKYLEIWVEVPDGPHYNGVNITTIRIKQVLQPHDLPVNNHDSAQFDVNIIGDFDSWFGDVVRTSNDRTIKVAGRIKILNPITTWNNSMGLFYMVVITDDETGNTANVPCTCGSDTNVAVTVNLIPLYNRAIKLFNAFTDKCADNRAALLDIFWARQMLLDAIMLEDYTTAIFIYNNILQNQLEMVNCLDGCRNNVSNVSLRNPCNCR